MFQDLRKDLFSVRILIALLIIATSIYLFQVFWQLFGLFSDIIIIIVSAWIVSVILDPLVGYIVTNLKTSRLFGTLIVYILVVTMVTLFIFMLIPTITIQIQELTKIVPGVVSNYPQFSTKWATVASSFLDNSLFYISYAAQFIFNALLILIFSFYFVVDKEKLDREVFELTPAKWHKNIHFIQEVIENAFGSFLRVQVILGIIIGVTTWIVLTLLKVDFAASTSFIAGLLAIVPFIGPILALIPPVLVTLISNPTVAFIVLLILVLIQQVIFNIIGPRLLGNAFKIHPAIIFASILIGTRIAGPIGSVIAVPIAGSITIILREFGHRFGKS